MAATLFRSQLVMLQGVQDRWTGFVRISHQNQKYTLQFRVTGLPGHMEDAYAFLLFQRRKRKSLCGLLRVDNRGQGGLLREMDPRKFDGFTFEEVDTIVIADGQERVLLAASLTNEPLNWDEIRRTVQHQVQPSIPKQQMMQSQKSEEKILQGAIPVENIAVVREVQERPDVEIVQPKIETQEMEIAVHAAEERQEADKENAAEEEETHTTEKSMPKATESVQQASRGDVTTHDEDTLSIESAEETSSEGLSESVLYNAMQPAQSYEHVLDILLEWPEDTEDLQTLFQAGQPCNGLGLKDWQFVRTPMAGGGQSLLGIRTDAGRVIQTACLLQSDEMPEPPPGLPGYTYARSTDGTGYWTRWRQYETEHAVQ